MHTHPHPSHLSWHLFLLACLLCGACSSDDLTGYVPSTDQVVITQNNLLFTAAGNTATLTVEAATPVEASLDATWCTAAVDGNVITVTAEANYRFEGRTALLTLTAGAATRQVPVQQLGMVLDLPLVVNGHHSPIEGDVFTIPVQHNVPLELKADVAWIHPVAEEDAIRVTVDDNQGGHIRRGMVVCSCGDIVDTLRIAQFDMTDDVVGSYYMMGYYGGDPNTPSAARFDIIQRNDSLFLNWPTQRYQDVCTYIPFDEATCTMYIPSNFQLYTDGRTTDTAYFYDTNGVVCVTSGAGASARLVYTESVGYNSAGLYAYQWPGHTLEGFVVRSVSLVPTILFQLSSPILMRVGPPGTTLAES